MAIRGDGVYSELYVTPHWYLLSFDNINYKEPVPYHRILYILVGQMVFFIEIVFLRVSIFTVNCIFKIRQCFLKIILPL